MIKSLLPSQPPGRDYYTEFIEGSRWLRKEQADARTAWFEGLPWEQKEKTLFKFEMLLKGLVCFGNPANHPGPIGKDKNLVAREFSGEMGIVLSILRAVVETGRVLAGEEDNSLVFRKYLESVVVQDHARIQMSMKALAQDTPEQSLSLMMSAMRNVLEVVEGLSHNTNVSFGLFSSIIKITQREIHRSEYFDPLASMEFRIEFDRIQNIRVLEVIAEIETDPSRRVAALAFLTLFRLLRYLDLIDEDREDAGSLGPLYAFLALLRSETAALAAFFKRDASVWMSEDFGKAYERLEAKKVLDRYKMLSDEFEELKSLKELLNSLGNQLDLELRKLYEQQIPALELVDDLDVLKRTITKSTTSLRSFLQNAILLLANEFSPNTKGEEIFADFTSDRARSERLRRDIWMFQQILRAFIAKAKGTAKGTTDASDRWEGMNTFRFVREFVTYFKSMGYQLLRYSDYSHFDNFMASVDTLRDADMLEPKFLVKIVSASEDFNTYLGKMFQAVSRREELKDCHFDKKDAAKTLKLFLKF